MTVDRQLYLIKRGGSKQFDEAVSYCDSFGMSLPVPTDENFVKSLVKLEHGEIWLGISDERIESNWTNFYTGEPFSYKMLLDIENGTETPYWEEGEPNNHKGVEHHAILNINGNWSDVQQDSSQNTICIWGSYTSQIITVRQNLFQHLTDHAKTTATARIQLMPIRIINLSIKSSKSNVKMIYTNAARRRNGLG